MFCHVRGTYVLLACSYDVLEIIRQGYFMVYTKNIDADAVICNK